MKAATNHKQFPKLAQIFQELAYDNMLQLKPQIDWQRLGNPEELEAVAAGMTKRERLILAAGEYDQCRRVVAKHNAKRLHRVVGRVFDGNLSNAVFEN